MPLRSLIEPMPAGMQAEIGVWRFDPDGVVAEQFGFADDFASFADVDAALSEDRAASRRELDSGQHLVVTFPRASEAVWQPFVDAWLAVELERQQLEDDLESMSASSLALLEETSMVGHVMTELATGDTEERIVQLGLESLLVGASAERVAYFRYNGSDDVFEFVVQVVYDEIGRRAVAEPYAGATELGGDGLLGAARSANASGCLWRKNEHSTEGDGPEYFAAREVLAMPVFFGHRAELLGVILVYDKRETSYSSVTTFGSHETKMAGGLASMLAAVLGARKTAELGKELKMANAIQTQILPDRAARVNGFDLAGRCETSGAVGGDYFDYLEMSDGRTLCVVADVSGHNLASGMVMVSARSALRVLTSTECDISQIFSDLAASMYTDLHRTERFITAAGVAIDPANSTVELVNAGHNDTMVYRSESGTVERLPSADTILGFVSGVTYESTEHSLMPGDVVVLYTDGVTEAQNAAGEMFEEARLAEVIRVSAGGTAQEILDTVYRSVAEFADEADSDDVTAIVVKYLGEKDGRV